MHRRSAQQLIAALASLCAASVGMAEPRSFEWEDPADWFGGFSAIEVRDGGHEAFVVSDRGQTLTIRIERDETGIAAVIPDAPVQVRNHLGDPIDGPIADSEGLALLPEGGFCISYEALARVACYADQNSAATPLRRPKDFREIEGNRALEALAVGPRGDLFALPETAPKDGRVPIYRWSEGTWSIAGHLPVAGRFRPVGADFGPDGHLYVLERGVRLGFRSRIRRIRFDDAQSPGSVETIWISETRAFDNLEGISIWTDKAGQVWATMISDDNFMFFQRTEIVEIPLPFPLAKGAATH